MRRSRGSRSTSGGLVILTRPCTWSAMEARNPSALRPCWLGPRPRERSCVAGCQAAAGSAASHLTASPALDCTSTPCPRPPGFAASLTGSDLTGTAGDPLSPARSSSPSRRASLSVNSCDSRSGASLAVLFPFSARWSRCVVRSCQLPDDPASADVAHLLHPGNECDIPTHAVLRWRREPPGGDVVAAVRVTSRTGRTCARSSHMACSGLSMSHEPRRHVRQVPLFPHGTPPAAGHAPRSFSEAGVPLPADPRALRGLVGLFRVAATESVSPPGDL